MTKSQAHIIMNACREYHVPTPRIQQYPPNGYAVRFDTNRFNATISSYEAAKHIVNAMILEQRGSGYRLR